MDIKAAVATAPDQPFEIRNLQLGKPKANEILVRIKGVGICHTDLAAKMGLMPPEHPSVLGHEGSGIVETIGSDVTSVKPGDHVVLSFASCGSCSRCTHDSPAYCETWPILNVIGTRADGSPTVMDGDTPVSAHFFGQSSFATHALTYEANTVRVDPELPIELLGPLGCGIQTGAGTIMHALNAEEGSSVAIYGGGSVGLSAVLGAAVQKCGTIILVEPTESRRKLALELGATHVIDPTSENVTEEILKITTFGVNYGFDTTGISAVIEQALAVLAPRGELALVGIPPNPEAPMPTFNPGDLMATGKKIRGIIEGEVDPLKFIPTMLEHYAAGNFPFDRLIKTFPFDQINEAIDAQHKGECIKAVLVTD